eukprot:gene25352-biopygen18001
MGAVQNNGIQNYWPRNLWPGAGFPGGSSFECWMLSANMTGLPATRVRSHPEDCAPYNPPLLPDGSPEPRAGDTGVEHTPSAPQKGTVLQGHCGSGDRSWGS